MMTRREFLKVASAGLVTGCISPSIRTSRVGQTDEAEDEERIIDPSPGGPFRDPATIPMARSTETINGVSRKVVTADLKAMISPVNVHGTTANLMTYNGTYPGPTIRVARGDILRLNFTNSFPHSLETNLLGIQKNATNLHTHGWHVSPQEPSDAIFLKIMPGQAYSFEYDLFQQPGGAFGFYHPHLSGVSAEQNWAGLGGVWVVEDETPVLGEFETHILVLKDITLNGSKPEPHSQMPDYMHGKEGKIVMVNGQVNPILPIRPGQVQRWRILNAGNARIYKLSLENHDLYLVGTDGGLLDKAYPRSQILLSPGEKVDILVKAGTSKGTYKLLSLPYSRFGIGISGQITLMTLSVEGSVTRDWIPSSINPHARRTNMDTSSLPHRTLILSLGMGKAYINGQDFRENPYTITSSLGTHEVWRIVNETSMDHPFHQHVNASQILSIKGADPAYPPYAALPAYKDNVLVPKLGSVDMLVPVRDYSGVTVFHCHMLEHEDIGMMGKWDIRG